MSLLREIQDAAISSTTKVSDVLRKAKVLAARLDSAELKRWVDRELNGYDKADNLPKYREIPVASYGNFYGPFGSSIRNVAIPPSSLPKAYHDFATNLSLCNAISYFEDLVASSLTDPKQELTAPWPADFITLADKLFVNHECLSAWRSVSRGSLVALLDTVRNKLLDFALEIEAKNPEAGEAALGSTPVPSETVSQIFNTVINGGSAVVGGLIANVQQITVNAGDVNDLTSKLASIGVEAGDIADLKNAIHDDPKPSEPGKLGRRVTDWLGRMTMKTVTTAREVGTKISVDLAAKLILAFYGMHGGSH